MAEREFEPARHGGVIRRLASADATAFREHLLRLDAESRYDRFGMAVSDDFLRQYSERSVGLDDVMYGFFIDGTLRGAGELRRLGVGQARLAEAAFSVERPWRRRGVGREMMRRIVRAARNRRAQTLYMSCLSRNAAMQSLAREFSAQLRFEPGEAPGAPAIAAPSAFSLLYDAFDGGVGFATAMLDLQRRMLGGAPTGERKRRLD
jgi:GNAT superfamily N-acetyltransferase